MSYVLTTCPFCGCGCGLYLQVQGKRVLGVAPSPGHPVAQGKLCVKGWHAHELTTSPQRLHSPLIRRNGELAAASWEEALQTAASLLRGVRETHGPAALAALGSTRATNEENYLLARLARCALGTNNVDFAARVEALPGAFDLPEYRHLTLPAAVLEDIGRADLIVLWQCDPAHEHPAAAARVLRAAEAGVPVMEVSTRSGQLGRLACCRLTPRPGSDVHLAHGLLRAALAAAQPTTPEAQALAAAVAEWTPQRTQAVTGVPAEALVAAAEALAHCSRPLVLATRGATLGWHGSDMLQTLWVLTSTLAEPGSTWSGLLWLTLGSNLQGARDMGVVPYFLSGYQPVADQHVREKFAAAWGVEPPAEPGLFAWDMLDRVKGLLVMGDDPTQHLPAPGPARELLTGLEALVVVDSVRTAVVELAHVALPGTVFAEKEGTLTSADRRVQRVRAAAPPPREARPEWEALCELSAHLGHPMSYASPAAVMDEIAGLTPLYEGFSHRALDQEWAARLPEFAEAPVPVLAEADEAAEAAVDERFPLLLALDCALDGWAADALVRSTAVLGRELGATRPVEVAKLEMNPADAERAGLRTGDRARVVSRAGEMETVVRVNAAVAAGAVVLPFAQRELAAQVMPPAAHPETGVPVIAPCAVRVERSQA